MEHGYYLSLDAELAGHTVLPTSAESLDAYVVPIALKKAQLAGIAVPEHAIRLDKLLTPSLTYPVNPFSSKYQLVTPTSDHKAQLTAVTSNGKYACVCELLPEDYRIDTLRAVLGKSTIPEYKDFAEQLFELFRLPLMRVRVIVTSNDYLLSAIEPLPLAELNAAEQGFLEAAGGWPA